MFYWKVIKNSHKNYALPNGQEFEYIQGMFFLYALAEGNILWLYLRDVFLCYALLGA